MERAGDVLARFWGLLKEESRPTVGECREAVPNRLTISRLRQREGLPALATLQPLIVQPHQITSVMHISAVRT